MDKDTTEKQSNTKGFIQGEIIFTIFENHAEHFSIAKIKIHDTNEAYEEKEIVGKGHFTNLQNGVVYQFFGELVHHTKFGLQYDITAYKTFVPETKEAVMVYYAIDIYCSVGIEIVQEI